MAEPTVTDLAAGTLGGQAPAITWLQVLDALDADEFLCVEEGTGQDGYALFRPLDGTRTHVVVVPVFDGALQHMATPGVRRATAQRLVCALADAGFAVSVFEHDRTPVAMAVARTDAGAERGIAHLEAAQLRCAGCRREPPLRPTDGDLSLFGVFCAKCIDRCHESTDLAHRCPVCAWPDEEASNV